MHRTFRSNGLLWHLNSSSFSSFSSFFYYTEKHNFLHCRRSDAPCYTSSQKKKRFRPCRQGGKKHSIAPTHTAKKGPKIQKEAMKERESRRHTVRNAKKGPFFSFQKRTESLCPFRSKSKKRVTLMCHIQTFFRFYTAKQGTQTVYGAHSRVER